MTSLTTSASESTVVSALEFLNVKYVYENGLVTFETELSYDECYELESSGLEFTYES